MSNTGIRFYFFFFILFRGKNINVPRNTRLNLEILIVLVLKNEYLNSQHGTYAYIQNRHDIFNIYIGD